MKTILCYQLHIYLIKVQTNLIGTLEQSETSFPQTLKLMSTTSSKYFFKKRINIWYILLILR